MLSDVPDGKDAHLYIKILKHVDANTNTDNGVNEDTPNFEMQRAPVMSLPPNYVIIVPPAPIIFFFIFFM